MPRNKEFKVPKDLLAKADALVDPVLQAIPENPIFSLNSAKQLRIFDASTLTGMHSSVQECKSLIHKIDSSGPTGIGYIITCLPEDNDPAVTAGDEILKRWHIQFPAARYVEAKGEHHRQAELYLHECQLSAIDRALEQWVWDALPEEVRQIPELEGQLTECETELANSGENNSLQNIIAQLQEQLTATRTIRDSLQLSALKEQALMFAQVAMAIDDAEEKKWDLINFCAEDPAHVLNDEQFTALVCQAVDDLAARNYSRLRREEPGPLAKHLSARRDLQNEKRSNAEGSLRTKETANKEYHKLALGEVRDPINPTLYIDTVTVSCGKLLRDIIIGASLSVRKALPENIREFISQQEETDKEYSAKARNTFTQFCNKELNLPPEQRAFLSSLHVNTNELRVSSHLDKFGILKRNRSENSFEPAQNNRATKLSFPCTP